MERNPNSISPNPMPVLLESDGRAYECDLLLPKRPRATVVFSGSRGAEEGFCTAMAESLYAAGIAVLRLPFLEIPWDGEEEVEDHFFLGHALQCACSWLSQETWTTGLAQGLFGVGKMAAPMLLMATEPGPLLKAVVILEGSADMSEADLEQVEVPSLFIADALDPLDAELHQEVANFLHCESQVLLLDKLLVPPATALGWFEDHFNAHYRSPSDQSVHVRMRGMLHDASHPLHS